MKISPRDVEHVARLARLELSDAEKERMGRELDGILTSVSYTHLTLPTTPYV